jgi:hypothetical protein
MIAFAEQYPDPKIVATLSQQLSWSREGEESPLGVHHFLLRSKVGETKNRQGSFARMKKVEMLI